MTKPSTTEYDPFYQGYLDTLPNEVDIFAFLANQSDRFVQAISKYTPEDLDFAYAKGKWTRRELLGHCIDVERLMSFRAFTFLRGDQQPLPSFEQDDYVANGDFDLRSLESLLQEFRALRTSNLELFTPLVQRPEKLQLFGTATGKHFTVKALIFILAGHLEHHLRVLTSTYDKKAL